MTNLNILLIGGDSRQIELYKLLKKDFKSVFTYGLFENENSIDKCDVLILPFPVFKGDFLNAPFCKKKLSIKDIIPFIKSNTIVLGGKIPQNTFDNLTTVYDYANDEEFTVINAAITAETALYYAIDNSKISLINSNILIAGFGRIGKFLAKYLSVFTNKITISARKPKDFGYINALGFKPLEYKDLKSNINKFDFVFNTVPSKIFDISTLKLCNNETVFIDLASEPGGFDNYENIKIIKALGLPGKHAPKTAAKNIYKTIRPYLIKEEKT